METERKKTIGSHHRVALCLFFNDDNPWKQSKNCSGVIPPIRSEIEEAKQIGKNVLFSCENLDAVDQVNATLIEEVFSGFEVHVVVVYRRFFERIVSWWGEQYKGPRGQIGGGGMDLWNFNRGNVVSYLSRPAFLKDHISTLPLVQFYQQASFQVHILNFHSPGFDRDISASLLCSDLFEAPGVCNKVLEEEKAMVQRVGLSSTAYDELAVAARQIGLLEGKNISRPEARAQLKLYFEETLKMSESDFPKVCVEGESLELLYQISEMVESLVVPEYYNERGMVELADHFEKYKWTKFCSVDTEKLLSQRTVHAIFS